MNRMRRRSRWWLAAALVPLLGASTALLVTRAEAQMVRGTVLATGEEPQPLEGAIVRLLTPDSQHVSMVLSVRGGHFLLVAPRAGRYILEVEHVLYDPVQTTPFAIPATGTVTRQLTVTPRSDATASKPVASASEPLASVSEPPCELQRAPLRASASPLRAPASFLASASELPCERKRAWLRAPASLVASVSEPPRQGYNRLIILGNAINSLM